MSATALRQVTHQDKMARKALARRGPVTRSTAPTVPASARGLTLPAYERLARNMEAFGNTLSAAHQEALMCIVGRLTMLAAGKEVGRWAYPLPCGGGKTQAVVAWCAELYHQRQPWSVLVCQTQVEHLCELKRQLIKNGVPAGEVGLVHSYGDKASLPPTTGNSGKQILLATHQNVRTGQNIAEVNSYHGQPRSLMVWDESLLTSSHRSIEKLHLQQSLGFLVPMIENNRASADLREAIATAGDYWGSIKAEFARQADGREPREITLPRLEDAELARLVAAIPTMLPALAVRDFLAVSQAPLRVVLGSGGGGLITYNVVVPQELANVAVLDASWPIRDLQRLDQTIRLDPLFHGDVKSYETVTVYHLDGASGRRAMTEAFTKPRADRKVSREIAQVVKGLPEDKGVLLFTFKHDASSTLLSRGRGKVDMAAKLRGDLQAEGIDVDKVLANGKPRFAWLTWGQETSTSEYGYCETVIFAGVLHRADVDLAGAIAGQRDDLLAEITSAEVESVKRSEVAHSLLQALNRGSCRGTVAGKASPMSAYLMHYDYGIREVLSRAMPGLVWQDWEPRHIRAKSHTMAEAIQAITKALDALPADTTSVTLRHLKGTLGDLDVPARTWTRALDMVLEGGARWEREARSLIRS